jgi:hypothetical protein|tara:strand:- start:616 stop:876 length:261 start_codon:yes stop_codon:yes gene_type:complete
MEIVQPPINEDGSTMSVSDMMKQSSKPEKDQYQEPDPMKHIAPGLRYLFGISTSGRLFERKRRVSTKPAKYRMVRRRQPKNNGRRH